ncbi:MAG: protein translocase subunit SecD [Candidatus Fonsibacter lacus]
MLNFSRLKIGFILSSILFFFYIFLGNFSFTNKTNLFLNKKINLGLDLQGGSYLLLEIDINPLINKKLEEKLLELKKNFNEKKLDFKNLNISNNKITFEIKNISQKDIFIDIINKTNHEEKFFSRINKNNIEVTNKDFFYKIDKDIFNLQFTDEFVKHLKKDALNQSVEIVRKRVDQLGTKEPTIQQKGDGRILVELPGLSDPSTFKNILGKTAQLNFKFLKTSNSSGDNLGFEKIKNKSDGSFVEVEKKLIVSGENLIDAQPGFDRQTNQSIVSFKFDNLGAKKFANATKDNVGRPLAIILDNEILSSPVIREPILTGSGQISGGFTVEEANQLAILLRAGALPAPMKIIEERTVGADLGKDSIRYGIISFIAGFLLVFVYIIYAYKIFGFFANISLLLNIVILISVLSLFGSTLTLPGIAGIVLTVGMAIDTNVIIYERAKEELKIEKSNIIAFDIAYKKSLLTIIDSNLTTLIAGIILFYLGSGPVKGFAVTLCVGLITSFFTAFTISRLMVSKYLMANKNKIINI